MECYRYKGPLDSDVSGNVFKGFKTPKDRTKQTKNQIAYLKAEGAGQDKEV